MLIQYFKDPLPADSWEGIRDATREGDVSCQRNMFTGVLEGSEDCLFLNVYTPQVKTEQMGVPKTRLFIPLWCSRLSKEMINL